MWLRGARKRARGCVPPCVRWRGRTSRARGRGRRSRDGVIVPAGGRIARAGSWFTGSPWGDRHARGLVGGASGARAKPISYQQRSIGSRSEIKGCWNVRPGSLASAGSGSAEHGDDTERAWRRLPEPQRAAPKDSDQQAAGLSGRAGAGEQVQSKSIEVEDLDSWYCDSICSNNGVVWPMPDRANTQIRSAVEHFVLVGCRRADHRFMRDG